MTVEPQVIAYLARIANALERLCVSAEALFDDVEEEVVETQRRLTANAPEGVRWS